MAMVQPKNQKSLHTLTTRPAMGNSPKKCKIAYRPAQSITDGIPTQAKYYQQGQSVQNDLLTNWGILAQT